MNGAQGGQPPNYMAYDRTIVVFSPDGRLLQVEYARQMVKNGSTSIGIKVNDGVLLGTVKIQMPLAVAESYKKLYEVDEHIALVCSGSLADTRDLVSLGRVKSQINRVTYSEPISVHSLTTHICDRKHMVTQYAGVRPYGVGLLIGGVDESGARLFETEPSGTMIEWKAQAIGRGADKAKKILNKEYKDNMDTKSGIKLLLKAIKNSEKSIDDDAIEMLLVKKNGVKKVSAQDLKKK
ncbi:MAG: archaeal proteasome endopeptidase complex subunit alpha [Nanoarchaeota archaeon]|nr:archaeal proteasome endopeptidase complex subunit alpha [Nanoarchaeota archaeon]MBU1135545.1 archaeal proteasome endopeptidase complex subunit alpha [Nanoarchaeota archaeon]MBU2520390.1 archaeal proteasome endopeptidase complex subunit alpha [Nanoarchaeota archaeon]